ncbi:MAG: glycerol-3-phosphate acyltransferase [SAR202 cluster bacterium]|nr:glycerol-3-phosphate acyltransferase [SAR202 cluster bacterium]
MNEPWFYAVWIVGSYLLGSVMIGVLVPRLAGVDIRKVGTGNPGTANIWREVGAKYALSVFVLDIAKGAAVTVPIYVLDVPRWVAFVSIAALLAGQFWPVFFRFKGGTGMAAVFGTVAGLLPWGAVVGGPLGALFMAKTKNVGWAGGIFLGSSLIVGGILHTVVFETYRGFWDNDYISIIALAFGMAAVFIKNVFQYRGMAPPSERPKGPRQQAATKSAGANPT